MILFIKNTSPGTIYRLINVVRMEWNIFTFDLIGGTAPTRRLDVSTEMRLRLQLCNSLSREGKRDPARDDPAHGFPLTPVHVSLGALTHGAMGLCFAENAQRLEDHVEVMLPIEEPLSPPSIGPSTEPATQPPE